MLVYVDDVLHLAKDVHEDMLKLNQFYQFKEGFGPPYRYLGDNINKFQFKDGRTVWSMTCGEYLQGDINNVDSIL